jgi:hypothetical protein
VEEWHLEIEGDEGKGMCPVYRKEGVTSCNVNKQGIGGKDG